MSFAPHKSNENGRCIAAAEPDSPLTDSKPTENSATRRTPTTSISPTKRIPLGTAWLRPGSSGTAVSRVSGRRLGIRTKTCRSTMPRSSSLRITRGRGDGLKRLGGKRESRSVAS